MQELNRLLIDRLENIMKAKGLDKNHLASLYRGIACSRIHCQKVCIEEYSYGYSRRIFCNTPEASIERGKKARERERDSHEGSDRLGVVRPRVSAGGGVLRPVAGDQGQAHDPRVAQRPLRGGGDERRQRRLLRK